MVLDLLPFKESHARVPRLGRLRYVHFGISLGIVLLAWFAFSYRPFTDTGLATAKGRPYIFTPNQETS